MANKTSEKDIEKYLVRKVKQQGGWAIKLTSSGNWGLPDRIVLLPIRKIAFAELKSTGRKPTPRQTRIMNILKKLGFITVVIDSIPRVNAFLDYMSKVQFKLILPSTSQDAKSKEN